MVGDTVEVEELGEDGRRRKHQGTTRAAISARPNRKWLSSVGTSGVGMNATMEVQMILTFFKIPYLLYLRNTSLFGRHCLDSLRAGERYSEDI